MQKKLLTIASALLLSTVIAGSVAARDGFYIAARGGITNSNFNDIEDSVNTKAAIDFDNVWMMGGAVGYRYSYFRGELEYSYREDNEDVSDSGLSSTKFGAQNLMLNGYIDFMPNYVISPYISGGIGFTKMNLDLTSTVGGAQVEDNYEETNFTWSVGAGLTIRVNQCLNIDGGYRYLDMGEIEQANINAHEIYFGLRYTF